MEKEKYTAYVVKDDEWKQIYGKGQLLEFAMERMSNTDSYTEDNINFILDDLADEEHADSVRKAINDYLENDTEVTDVDIAITILTIDNYYVEELELY